MKQRPHSHIARDLAAIEVSEGLLTELGFTVEERDGRSPGSSPGARRKVWVFDSHNSGGPFAPGLPMGYGSIELFGRVLDGAFEERDKAAKGPFPKRVTVLHLMLAAYIGGIWTGSAQAKGRMREALGL